MRWITVGKKHIPVDENKDTGTCIRQYYKGKQRSVVTKKEAAEVTHAINTDCNIYKANSKYKIGGTYSKAYKNHVYKFKIHEYNEYEFTKKIKIK